MGRPKGSKNKGKRAKARSPYQTYSDWYDKYTKGHKKGWFRPKLGRTEFESLYNEAKRQGMTNPARTIARAQEYVDRKFEREYKKFYGEDMPDLSNKEDRIALFENFVNDRLDEGYDYDEAREMFETYFY